MAHNKRPAWIGREFEKDINRKIIAEKSGANRRLEDIIEIGSNKIKDLDRIGEEDQESQGIAT